MLLPPLPMTTAISASQSTRLLAARSRSTVAPWPTREVQGLVNSTGASGTSDPSGRFPSSKWSR